MKALLFTGPNTLEWREQPEPTPGNDEVVVRVDAVGICGSDMHAYHGQDTRRPPPLVIGHEAAGRIVNAPRGRAPRAGGWAPASPPWAVPPPPRPPQGGRGRSRWRSPITRSIMAPA